MAHSNNIGYPDRYLVFCIESRCNNSCQHCLLRGIKFEPVSFKQFSSILSKDFFPKYNSIVFSGAEATLNKNIKKFVTHARAIRGINHIRIQTNGRRLSDYSFCRSLVSYGVDEFFISIYGPNSSLHDYMTDKKGSFNQTFQGLRNLNKINALTIISIAVTSMNYNFLPEIVKKLSDFNNIREINFWVYFSRRIDNLLVSNPKIKPYLISAVKKTAASGRNAVIKYYPACLLGKYKKFLDNSQPATLPLIKVDILNSCPDHLICEHKECYGLLKAYVDKFGKDFY